MVERILATANRIDDVLELVYSQLTSADNEYLKRLLARMGRDGFRQWIDEHTPKLIHLSRQEPETIVHYLYNNFQREDRLLMIYALFVLLQSARVLLQAMANYELTTCKDDELIHLAGFAAMFLWSNRPPEYPFDFDNPFEWE